MILQAYYECQMFFLEFFKHVRGHISPQELTVATEIFIETWTWESITKRNYRLVPRFLFLDCFSSFFDFFFDFLPTFFSTFKAILHSFVGDMWPLNMLEKLEKDKLIKELYGVIKQHQNNETTTSSPIEHLQTIVSNKHDENSQKKKLKKRVDTLYDEYLNNFDYYLKGDNERRGLSPDSLN